MQKFLAFDYDIEANNRVKRGFRVTTYSSGYLLFKFPKNASKKEKQAQEYMQENYDEILKTLDRLKKRVKKADEKRHTERQEQDAFVESYLAKHANSLIIFDKSYEVCSLSIESISQILYNKSKEVLDRVAAKMGLECPRLAISYTKGYLGQCRRDMIKIDYRNALSHESLLEYLATHELSHLRFMNHSKDFWCHVSKYYPDYKEAKKELILKARYNAQILKHYGLLPIKLGGG